MSFALSTAAWFLNAGGRLDPSGLCNHTSVSADPDCTGDVRVYEYLWFKMQITLNPVDRAALFTQQA